MSLIGFPADPSALPAENSVENAKLLHFSWIWAKSLGLHLEVLLHLLVKPCQAGLDALGNEVVAVHDHLEALLDVVKATR